MREPNHFRRIVVIWALLTAICWPLVVFVFNPDLPPGRGADDAQGVIVDQSVLYAVAVPIALALLVYFAYVLIVFQERGPSPREGVAIPEDPRVGRTWLAVTSLIAFGMAAFGTVRLLEGGAGGGQGPDPLTPPGGKPLEVQVIGQQWQFTYRYPSYGGVETQKLVLPAGRQIELHVTSLDVIHSFWAYELGVKADANPGADNVTYVKAEKPGSFQIRCAELCGLWHGYMFDAGRVADERKFETWIRQERRRLADATKALPPYSHVYYPEPVGRAG
ncbi:MAG: cytochrome c oxidase subunit [Solirubrobacterales bacterium]|jgi:cytochrome c oxidase subunit 2|nr:cytochrome c oxidase subunit [Solirubrobacterales bacterium]